MRGIIMFPVIVLIMLTLVGAPAFWTTEGYDVTRTVTVTQLNAVTDAVHLVQDDYGYDTFGSTKYLNYTLYYSFVVDTFQSQLNVMWPIGLNETIVSMHGLMAENLMDLVGELGNPAGSGAYATTDQVGEILDTSNYGTIDTGTYDQYVSFDRSISSDQIDEIYEAVKDLQDDYGSDAVAPVKYIQWNAGTVPYLDVTILSSDKAKVINAIVVLLDDQFGTPSDPLGDDHPLYASHRAMAEELAGMIYDAGDPAGAGAYLDKDDVFGVIRTDPSFSSELDRLETYGIGLSSIGIFVGVLIGIVMLSFVSGITLFGSGLSDSSVHMVVHYTVYFLLWGILSVGSRTFILDTAYIGIPVWVILTLMYTFGVIGQVSGGSE